MSLLAIKRTTAIALSLAVSSFLMPTKAEANPAIVAPVAVCVASTYCTIAVVVIGGLAYWKLTNGEKITHIPLAPVLNNPDEQLEDWTDYIWADSELEAKRKCEALAEGWRVQLAKVRKVGKGKRYECTFRG